ncbi:Hypothetical predicted protein [Xyrichtys novacula]|uniref:Uncharacterized protein n=1 Tax=Xyrichtys novacula TaxID=13765 RepID=A0AAV1FZS2_XYRNO|nr:Hypothetical predicted protein [Xyrichtys novacula]
MIVLVKGQPVLCSVAFIELSGAVGMRRCQPACPPPASMGSITPPPPRETQPPQLLQLLLMGHIFLSEGASEPYGAFQSQGQSKSRRKSENRVAGLLQTRDTDGERKRRNVVTSIQADEILCTELCQDGC